MIQGIPLSWAYLKADADLSGILQEYLLIGHDNKTGGIGAGLVHTLLKDLKSGTAFAAYSLAMAA